MLQSHDLLFLALSYPTLSFTQGAYELLDQGELTGSPDDPIAKV
jgi:hypothetical protein